jgi:putative heme-binding domain-containing protein
VLKREALAALSKWTAPSVLDRVDGRFRGEIQRDSTIIKSKLIEEIPLFLEDKDPNILIGIADVLRRMEIDDFNNTLFQIFKTHKSPEVKSAVLQALGDLNFKSIQTAVQMGMKNTEQMVRSTAIGLIEKLDIPKEKLPHMVLPIFKYGTIDDQQKMLSTLGELPFEKTETILQNLALKAKNNQLSKSIMLDLTEAIEKSKSKTLMVQMEKANNQGNAMVSYKDALFGGDAQKGYDVFNNNSTAQCVRCHAVNNAGGKVGPKLDHIAKILNKEQILEALIEPSARLAPGFGSVVLTLKDGQVITGVLEKENTHELILRTSEAEPMKIPLSRIKKRENMVSSMPAMGTLINKRELRDLIAYLSTLK